MAPANPLSDGAGPAGDAEAPDRFALRERRNLIFLGAALILGFAIIDDTNNPRFLRSLLLRLFWSSLLAGVALALPRFGWRTRQQRALLLAGAIASPLFYGLIVQENGGLDSPHFTWLFSLPIAIVVVVGDEGLVALACGLSTVLATVLLARAAHVDVKLSFIWASLAACSAVIAVAASRSFQRLRRAAAEASRARSQAMKQLTESEKQRGHDERLAFVGRLAAGVAHEINNPLAYIQANFEYLRDQLKTGEPRPELMAVIAESELGVERIHRIVLYLQEFSKERTWSPTMETAATLWSDALQLVGPRCAAFELERAIAADLPPLCVHRKDIARALAQLVSNAMDASETGAAGRRWIRIGAVREGAQVRLFVEDSGPGIPPAVMEQLYVPFFTTKPPGRGTGLGLALARENVRRSGGALELVNLAQGACAQVTFPAARPPAPPPAVTTSPRG